jgi:integrase
MAAQKRPNGEGTIYRRKDGRWEGAMFVLSASGDRKRVRVYGRTRQQVHDRLASEKAKAHQGIPAPDRAWRLEEYLDYWLDEVLRRTRRPATYALYETVTRLYLKPGLGSSQLARLSVPMVQQFLNSQLTAGCSVPKVQAMKKVLSSALTRAMREELITRNVAQLVTLPTWTRKDVGAWSADESRSFLRAAEDHPLYPAFLLLLLYGLRRGETLGLRWSDVDFETGTIHIRQQLQRIGRQLVIGPLKTHASRRDLPMLAMVRSALMRSHEVRLGARGDRSPDAVPGDDLVFMTATGQPIEPSNFVRSFERLCARAEVRRIRVHDLRRTAATLLNKLGVPPRDAQLILGHSRIALTQEIYTDVDRESKTFALNRMQGLFAGDR